MLKEISPLVYNQWMAYYSLEPFGVHQDNRRFSNLMSLITNLALGSRKASKFTPKFFLEGLGDLYSNIKKGKASLKQIYVNLMSMTRQRNLAENTESSVILRSDKQIQEDLRILTELEKDDR